MSNEEAERLDTLSAQLQALPHPDRDVGVLDQVVIRPARGHRGVLRTAWLDTEAGVRGDRWSERAARYPGRYDLRQVTLIRSDVARVLTAPQHPMWTGDNLHVHIDLSVENLPVGSQLQIGGSAVIEMSRLPHLGCARFRDRFGVAAARINSAPAFKGWRLRGAMAVVVCSGRISQGDRVIVVRRNMGEM